MNCYRPTTLTKTRQDEVTSEWNSLAGEWDDLAYKYANGCFKLFVQTIGKEMVVSLKEQQQPLVIIDFGCGTGLLTSKLQSTFPICTTKIISIDASPAMIDIVQDKIRDMDWTNVEAYTTVLARLADIDGDTKKTTEVDQSINYNNNNSETSTTTILSHRIKELYGTVDIIVASSVLSFIPEEDVVPTMNVLGRLLKSNTGLFFHTDWPISTERPYGMTVEKANILYNEIPAPLESSTSIQFMEECNEDVFIGLVRRK